MGAIIIHKASGSGTVDLTDPGKAVVIRRAEQHRVIISEDVVNIELTSPGKLDIGVGDWIAAYGTHYKINRPPKITERGKRFFDYEIVFEGPQYDLLRAQYRNADVSGFNPTGDFSLTGDLKMFLDVLITNAVRVFGEGSWSLGDYPSGTDTKTLTYTNQSCLAVLQDLCQQYEQEFFITQDGDGNSTLNIGKTGDTLEHTYKYGAGNGLYRLTREQVSSKQVVNRLYAYGSTENLKIGYRDFSPRLRMGTNAESYVENSSSIAAFGVIEGTKIWEDIKPQREGSITALVDDDINSFVDSAMDFDLNEVDGEGNTKYLIPGTTAKIHFNTGALAGYEFEVSSYNHGEKQFTIIPSKDPRGMSFPSSDSSAFQLAVGDKYVIVDIVMPDSYVTTAEANLQTVAQDYVDTFSQPSVQYSLLVDELYLREVYGTGLPTNVFEIGDFIPVEDSDIGVDKDIRIIEFTRDLIFPYRYKVNVADTYDVTVVQQLIADNRKQNNILRLAKLNDPARVRNTWRTTQELLNMVFDQDDYFKDGNIRPGSIETLMLAVGARSQQMALSGVVIQPNYLGDGNVVAVTSNSGTLTNFTIGDTVQTWQIASGSTTIPDNNARYIYAKCSKTDHTDGSIVFDTTQRKVDSDPNYYYFLLGDLHSPDDGVRWISLTYGTTTINGRFIKTGVVQSADGMNYFDLDGNAFSLGSSTSGIDWNVTNEDALTVRGLIIQNPAGATDTLGVYRGEYNPLVTYYNGDSVTWNGSLWRFIFDSPLSGVEPTLDNSTWWKQIAAAGATGTAALRIIYNRSSDPDTPPDLDLEDPNPDDWLTQTPETDVHGVLATDTLDFLVTDDDKEIITSTEGQYVWMSVESKDDDGNFVSWSKPSRVTGLGGGSGNYTEFRFAKNGSTSAAPSLPDASDPDPDGWSISQPTLSIAEYLWVISAVKTPDGNMVTTWSSPTRMTGIPGPKGDPGEDGEGSVGPYLMYRGAYDNTKEYYGGDDRLEAVYYNGLYYVTRRDAGTFSGLLPINTSKWNVFSGQFESIATGLLLAELAYIDNLGVRFVRTTGADQEGKRIEIDGVNNTMKLFDGSGTLRYELNGSQNDIRFFDNSGNVIARIGDNAGRGQASGGGVVGTGIGGMIANDVDENRVSSVTGDGVFSNGSDVPFAPGSTGIVTNASLVGLLQKKNSSEIGISAGVVGLDQTSGSGSKSYGGYFNSAYIGKLFMSSLNFSIRSIVESENFTDEDTWLTTYHTSGSINITLPVGTGNQLQNRFCIVTRVNTGGVTIIGNIFNPNVGLVTSIVIEDRGRTYLFGHDGNSWICAPIGL